jgi:hypothetical protein
MGRRDTRTYHRPNAAPAAPPVEQVQDPAMRAILAVVVRAMAMVMAEIQRRTNGGQEPPVPP